MSLRRSMVAPSCAPRAAIPRSCPVRATSAVPLVEKSIIVLTTARQSPVPRPDDERGLSSSAASAFAAAG